MTSGASLLDSMVLRTLAVPIMLRASASRTTGVSFFKTDRNTCSADFEVPSPGPMTIQSNFSFSSAARNGFTIISG